MDTPKMSEAQMTAIRSLEKALALLRSEGAQVLRLNPPVDRGTAYFVRPQNGGFRQTGILCRGLCHNPATPAHVCRCREVLLHKNREAANSDQSRMNTASLYHSVSFAVVNAPLRLGKWHGRGRRFDPGQVHQIPPNPRQKCGPRSLSTVLCFFPARKQYIARLGRVYNLRSVSE